MNAAVQRPKSKAVSHGGPPSRACHRSPFPMYIFEILEARHIGCSLMRKLHRQVTVDSDNEITFVSGELQVLKRKYLLIVFRPDNDGSPGIGFADDGNNLVNQFVYGGVSFECADQFTT